MSVVILENITKCFGDTTILNNVNLTVDEGQIVGIIGRNGSGKTILLKMICGLMLPTGGSVNVFGEKIGITRDFSDNTGILIETPEFLPYQSALESLYSLSVITRKANKERISEILHLVGLDPSSRKPVGKYSLGMRQRLGIAQALLDRPKLLLLDEPMNGLDSMGAQEMRSLLKRLREEGTTIILATHIKEDIDGLCEQVYSIENCELKKGK